MNFGLSSLWAMIYKTFVLDMKYMIKRFKNCTELRTNPKVVWMCFLDSIKLFWQILKGQIIESLPGAVTEVNTKLSFEVKPLQ